MPRSRFVERAGRSRYLVRRGVRTHRALATMERRYSRSGAQRRTLFPGRGAGTNRRSSGALLRRRPIAKLIVRSSIRTYVGTWDGVFRAIQVLLLNFPE